MNVSDEGARRRLLYCSSVSPQESGAGHLLVLRHLRALTDWDVMTVCPADRPVSPTLFAAHAVHVREVPPWMRRLRRGALFGCADRMIAAWLASEFRREALRFRPQLVVSVMLPDSYLAAAVTYAERAAIPLVLLCHDDYRDFVPKGGQKLLARAYRKAAVRLCVSPAMEEAFFRRYGVHGDVLYPIPGGPPVALALSDASGPVIIGFAGSIGGGYTKAMLGLADALAAEGGALVIATHTPRTLVDRLCAHRAVRDLGALPPDDVRRAFGACGVNAVAVVQSFAAAELPAFQLNFPSKLTEYATYGLPVLVVAPRGASASAWAARHPDAALCVTTHEPEDLAAAVRRLSVPAVRSALAAGFRSAAQAFDPQLLQGRFEQSLTAAICARESNATAWDGRVRAPT